jgi:predicted nucleic acid-binding protein
MTRVVDASAIGAVLFNETAAAWVRDETFGESLIAPVLFHFELGNLCWKKLRLIPLQAAALHRNWTSWNASCPVRAVDIDLSATMDVARQHQLTFYDASYLWLANDKRADLVSLDARLVRAARNLGINAPAPRDPDHTTPRSGN